MIIDEIKKALGSALPGASVLCDDESDQHHTKGKKETHFSLTVVSESFVDCSPIDRHRSVYELLQQSLGMLPHALSLHLYTPKEWENRQQTSPETPACLGGFSK